MNILSFAKLGITVISGLIISVGSVGNYTTSPITAEENLEAKGCAANFEKRSDYLFVYEGPDYSDAQVKDNDNWKYEPSTHTCGTEANVRACTILVSEDMVEFDEDENPIGLKDEFILSTSSQISNVFYVTGSNALSFDFYNEAIPL